MFGKASSLFHFGIFLGARFLQFSKWFFIFFSETFVWPTAQDEDEEDADEEDEDGEEWGGAALERGAGGVSVGRRDSTASARSGLSKLRAAAGLQLAPQQMQVGRFSS